MAWGRWGVLRSSTRGWGTPEDAAGGSSVSPEAQASARKNLNAGTGQAGRGPQVQPRCQASRRVSSCLQVGEHGSQACSSEHWRGSRPPASSGLPAPADTGPGHLPPTSAGPADERGRWGTGPECGVSSLPAPAGPSSRTQTSRLFSSSLAGALNRPLPSSWGGGLSPGGCTAGRPLAWLSESLLSPLRWNTTVTSPGPWGPSLGAREPRPGLHRLLTEPSDQRRTEDLVWEACIQSLLSTVFRPCFINPPFVQVPQPITLTKYPLKPSIPVLQGIRCWFHIWTMKGSWLALNSACHWPRRVEVSGEHLMGS